MDTQSSQRPPIWLQGVPRWTQGRPNLSHELFQSKTCIRDSSGTYFMAPKGSQNGSKMESETAHIFKPFRAAIWGPFWHLLGTQNGPNSRHNNMAKTKVRTTCGNAKMMEKPLKNNIFEQFCNPGGRPKLAKIKQKRWSENKTETVHVLEAFWHTLGPLLGAQNRTKMETKTKTKLERQKGGSEGSKRKNGAMRRDPSMHSILL